MSNLRRKVGEHLSDFLNFEEGSHLMKHYLTYHRNLKMSDVKFGMRVRNSFGLEDPTTDFSKLVFNESFMLVGHGCI